MKKSMLILFALFFSHSNLWCQSPTENDPQSYNEFKDTSIEFSLDDGDNESKFHFEDQNLIDKRMKELEAKKAIRKQQMKEQIAKEEAYNHKLEMMALQEKNKKFHDIRQNKIRALKLQQDKIDSLLALNHFHQLPHESYIPFRKIEAKKTESITRTLASSSNSHLLPLKAPQILKKTTANLNRTPAGKKEAANHGLLQRAKNKILDYFNHLKSFFQ